MSIDSSLDSLTVNELKLMLEERGLSKSGKKAELIERLNTSEESKVIELSSTVWTRNVVGQFNVAQVTGSVAAVLLLMVVVFNPPFSDLAKMNRFTSQLGLMQISTLVCSELVNLGHPEWEGRMSGSPEEAAAADDSR